MYELGELIIWKKWKSEVSKSINFKENVKKFGGEYVYFKDEEEIVRVIEGGVRVSE